MGPSWSVSTSWAKNATSEKLNVIWIANTRFSQPAPNTRSSVHTSVVVHGDTPLRRHSTRTKRTAATCAISAGTRNGQYESSENHSVVKWYTNTCVVSQCPSCGANSHSFHP